MELLRALLRKILGTNADEFIKEQELQADTLGKAQAEALSKLIDKHVQESEALEEAQALKKAVYISDVESSKAAKLALIEELSIRIQEETETLSKLKGDK